MTPTPDRPRPSAPSRPMISRHHVVLPIELYDQMAKVYYAYRDGRLVEAASLEPEEEPDAEAVGADGEGYPDEDEQGYTLPGYQPLSEEAMAEIEAASKQGAEDGGGSGQSTDEQGSAGEAAEAPR